MATNVAVRSPGKPRVRDLNRNIAMTLAATEYDRVVAQWESLADDQWALPTDCPGWDVRAIAGHDLGMARMVMTAPELVRQQIGAQINAKKSGASALDSLTALQVARNADLSRTDLIEQMHRVGPRAARRRRRVPAFIRNCAMPEKQLVGNAKERWTFGFLFDIILTRDPFMHRLDISRSTGIPLRATAEHEGVIVDDVVREWAGRHRQPYRLSLSGVAGGTWGRGDGEPISMDAFDFCRCLAGRGSTTGLLAQQVPF